MILLSSFKAFIFPENELKRNKRRIISSRSWSMRSISSWLGSRRRLMIALRNIRVELKASVRVDSVFPVSFFKSSSVRFSRYSVAYIDGNQIYLKWKDLTYNFSCCLHIPKKIKIIEKFTPNSVRKIFFINDITGLGHPPH